MGIKLDNLSFPLLRVLAEGMEQEGNCFMNNLKTILAVMFPV